MSKRLKIFTVEDNELYAMIIEHNLNQTENWNIINFSSGEECVKNLSDDPDVLVLDFNLKGMNGIETLKQIKAIKPELPVIVLSSQGDVQVAVDLIKEGAIDYVGKNNDPIFRLKQAIENLIQCKNDNR